MDCKESSNKGEITMTKSKWMAKERLGIKNGIPSGKEDNKIDNKEESDDYSVGADIESFYTRRRGEVMIFNDIFELFKTYNPFQMIKKSKMSILTLNLTSGSWFDVIPRI